MCHKSLATSRRLRGFSLVELVIVIVIIGIIAAIAIPRVGRGAKAAGESSLASNLSILRNSLELYASEHNGRYPGIKADGTVGDAALMLTQLTQYTKTDGSVNATFDGGNGFIYGPYLRKGIPPAPVGTNRGDTNIVFDTTNATPVVTSGTEGWVYNPNTGDIIVNSDDNNESGTTTYDTY